MKPRTVKLQDEINSIINKCYVGYIAMIGEDGTPYVIPMNFGIEGNYIYFHSAREGKKINNLKKNKHVSVAFSTDHQMYIRNESVACSYTMKYRSVLAHGFVEFIDNYYDKIAGLNVIMKHYTGRDFSYNAPAVNNVCVFRIVVEKFESRVYGY